MALYTVPGPPTVIKLTPLLSTAIMVIFAPPLETNGIVIQYRVSVIEEMTSNQLTVDTDVTSVTIKSLSPYTSYHIKVCIKIFSHSGNIHIITYSITCKCVELKVKGRRLKTQVKARTNAGWGSFSTIRTARTLEELPGSPTNFRIIQQSETMIGVQWTSPNFTRGILQGFKVIALDYILTETNICTDTSY